MSRAPSSRHRLSLALAALWTALPLAGALSLAAAEAEPGPILESVELTEGTGGWELVARSSAILSLVGVQRDPDGSLVVQLPNHRPGPEVSEIFPPAGPVASVRAAVEETARGPLTRVVVQPREPVRHTFSPEGNRLLLRIEPRRAADQPPADRAAAAQGARLREALAESESARGELEARIATLERENHELDERFAELAARRGELETALQTTLEEVRALGEDRSRRRAEIERLELELAAARQAAGAESESAERAANAEALAADRQVEIDSLRAALGELEDRAAGLERQLDDAATASSRLNAVGADLGAENRRLSIELEELRRELETLREKGLTRAWTTERVNLRAGPGMAHDVATVVLPNAVVEVVERGPDWTRIRVGDSDGWVFNDLIRLESDELSELRRRLAASEAEAAALRAGTGGDLGSLSNGPAQTSAGVHLRSGPGTGYAALELLAPGSEVEILGSAGEWRRVRVGAREGWVHAAYLRPGR